MQWLHFSDFHTGSATSLNREAMVALVDFIRESFEGISQKMDAIFLTGDIAYSGKEAEYEIFEQEFLHPLRSIPIFNEAKIFAVPGNHDVDCDAASPITWESIRERNQQIFFCEDDEGQKARKHRIKVFCNYLNFVQRNSIYSPNPFEEVSKLYSEETGYPFDILAINTAFFSDKQESSSTPITPCPLTALRKQLMNSIQKRPTIILGHHPQSCFLETQQTPFETLLVDKKVVYLHGHEHYPKVIANVDGTIRTIGFGACYTAPLGEKTQSRYRNSFVHCCVNENLFLKGYGWDSEVGRWDDTTRSQFSNCITNDNYDGKSVILNLPKLSKKTVIQTSKYPLASELKNESQLKIDSFKAYLPFQKIQPDLKNTQPSRWLQAYQGFVEMSYRESEKEELRKFIEQKGFFRWQVLIGEGGIGKTRLAIEFTKESVPRGWYAGVLDGYGLELFINSPGFLQWQPTVPTLIFIDYAASKKENLRKLFQKFASLELQYMKDHDQDITNSKVRIVLIERHGNENFGWLKHVMNSGESQAGDLLKNTCYQGLTELLPPHSNDSDDEKADAKATRYIIENTFKSWAKITNNIAPTLPDFSMDEWRRIQINTMNRPLYLQMAAIYACENGIVDHLPLWGRGELIWGAVRRELEYIRKSCGEHDDLFEALRHIAAILCIGGTALINNNGEEWWDIITDEVRNITTNFSSQDIDKYRKTIFHEPLVGDGDGETGLIQPDIVAEGFAAIVLLKEKHESSVDPSETFRRIMKRPGAKVWPNLIRLVQDLHGIPDSVVDGSSVIFKDVEKWPLSLLTECTIEQLKLLSDIIPERTESLRELGIKTHEMLIQKSQEQSIERAHFLTKLVIHRHRGNSRNKEMLEQTLVELYEAVDILRETLKANSSDEIYATLAKAHCEAGWIFDDLRILLEKPGFLIESSKQDLLGAFAATGKYPRDPMVIKGEIAEAKHVLELSPLKNEKCISGYANCLNNLMIRFLGQNEPDIAFEIIYRAVKYGRKLTAINWELYAPNLARYLNNLAKSQDALDKTEDAINSAYESIKIRKEFLCKRMDEYAEPLILSLETLGEIFWRKKNITGVIQILEEIVNLLIDLSARNPYKFRPSLAYKCQVAGYFCKKNNELKKAFEYLLRGFAVYKELIQSDYDKYSDDLVETHNNLTASYQALKEYEDGVLYLNEIYQTSLIEGRKKHNQHLYKIIDAARQGLMCSEKEGQLRDIQQWMDYYFSVKIDPRVQCAIDEHARAETLKENKNIKDAIQVMHSVAKIMKRAYEEYDPQNDFWKLPIYPVNLSSPLVLLGDWTGDVSFLKNAKKIIEQALKYLEQEKIDDSYEWGALYHNLGHALYRCGELEL